MKEGLCMYSSNSIHLLNCQPLWEKIKETKLIVNGFFLYGSKQVKMQLIESDEIFF